MYITTSQRLQTTTVVQGLFPHFSALVKSNFGNLAIIGADRLVISISNIDEI